MALLTPAAAGTTARNVVTTRLTSRDRDVKGLVLLVALLLSAGITLLVLFVLITRVVAEAMPVVQEKGFTFLSDTIGSNPATTGIWPGSVRLDLHRPRRRDRGGPARRRGRDLPRGVRLDSEPLDALDHGQHPQPGRRPGGHLRRARA